VTPLHVDEPAPAALVGVEFFFFFCFAAALSCGLQRYLGAVFFFLLAMSCPRPRSVAAGAAMEPVTVALSPLQVLCAIAETQREASAASRSDVVRRTALLGMSYICLAERAALCG
jgi:hypothetical protein